MAELSSHDEMEMFDLMQSIADESAAEIVDSSSLCEEIDGVEWRDLSDREFDYLAELEDELAISNCADARSSIRRGRGWCG